METINKPWFVLDQLDAIELLHQRPTGSVDLVVTDPAYESLEKHRAVGTTTRLKHSDASSNDWFPIFGNARFPELFAELYRVLKKDAHLYVFCDLDTAKVIDPMGQAAGFTMWNWITWDKQRMGMGYHYRRRKEFIVFFEKGKRRLNDLGVPDVLDGPTMFAPVSVDIGAEERSELGVDTISWKRESTKGYPTQKPVAVCDVLIKQSSKPGDIVLDPFAGSGATGVAAALGGRHFIGGDVKGEAIALARSRLSNTGAVESFGRIGGAR